CLARVRVWRTAVDGARPRTVFCILRDLNAANTSAMPVTLESNPNIIASQSQRDLGLLPGSCPLRRRLAQRLVSRVLRTLPAATYSGSVPERHGSLGICRPGLLISPQVQLGPFTRPASIVNLGSGTLK